jgi:hypothetical protein
MGWGRRSLLTSEDRVAPILPFPHQFETGFDDLTTSAMGRAYETACAELKDGHLSKIVCEMIAKRIIEAAKKGERDPTRLCSAALNALGYDRPAT